MQQTEAVRGWEVLYASSDESFRTVQCHQPAPGQFFTPIEINAVELEGVNGWTVDDTNPLTPKVRQKGRRTLSLNDAIRDGFVKVRQPHSRTVPIQNAG